MESTQASSTDPPPESGQAQATDVSDNPENITQVFPGNRMLESNFQDVIKSDSQQISESSVNTGNLDTDCKDMSEKCDESHKVNNVTEPPNGDDKYNAAHSTRRLESGVNETKVEISSVEENNSEGSFSNTFDVKESDDTIDKHVIPAPKADVYRTKEETNTSDETKNDREDVQTSSQQTSSTTALAVLEVSASLTTDARSDEYGNTLERASFSERTAADGNEDYIPEAIDKIKQSVQDTDHASSTSSTSVKTEINVQDSHNVPIITSDSNLPSTSTDSLKLTTVPNPGTIITSSSTSESIITSSSTSDSFVTCAPTIDQFTISAPVTDVRYSSSSNIDVCPFSGQPVGNPADDNLTDTAYDEHARTKADLSLTSPAIAYVSHEDTDRTTILLSKGNSLPSSTSDHLTKTSNTSLTNEAAHQNAAGGIRNLFPKSAKDNVSMRSKSDTDNTDGRTEGNKVNGEQESGDIVLVTGGCGFLGQHIVKLLHLRAPHVAEIRILDLTYFEKKLDYEPTKRMKSMVGDISNAEFVNKALNGVTSVIHVAGMVSWGTFPDFEGMERVNVKGTLNILNGCLKNNVQRLVYCSTVDVAVGHKPIRGGTEEDTPVPDKFLFPGYPETKYHGERIVQGSVQHKRDDGGLLQTLILRPNVLYGELDKYYITNALRMAKQSAGILYRIGNGTAMFQQAYVGNTAWAFVCADASMKANPQLTREVFYIPDNTPVQNSFNFMLPYLEAHGFKLSSGYLSYALSHSAVVAAEFFAKALSPLMKLNLPVQSCTIAYINTDLFFRGEKAKKLLNYEPIYTCKESREMSMKYYANLNLEEKPRERGHQHS